MEKRDNVLLDVYHTLREEGVGSDSRHDNRYL